jgi:hypothetical protein
MQRRAHVSLSPIFAFANTTVAHFLRLLFDTAHLLVANSTRDKSVASHSFDLSSPSLIIGTDPQPPFLLPVCHSALCWAREGGTLGHEEASTKSILPRFLNINYQNVLDSQARRSGGHFALAQPR